MRGEVIRTVACGLGLSFSGFALADYGFPGPSQYVSPSQWNNFNVPSAVTPHDVRGDVDPAELAGDSVAPSAPQATGSPLLPTSLGLNANCYHLDVPRLSIGQRDPTPESSVDASVGNPDSDLGSSRLIHAPIVGYSGALPLPHPSSAGATAAMPTATVPWDGGGALGSGLAGGCGVACDPAPPGLFPWFGGADLLFWSLANSSHQRLVLDAAAPATELLNTRDVDPGSGLGYDVFFGRYLEDGRHAISLNYLHFDPSGREASALTAGPGDFLTAIPAWQNIGYYADPEDVQSDFVDMQSIFNQMADYRATRDVRFQGLELNFWSFGLGGARRVAPAYGSGIGCALGHGGMHADPRPRAHGYGGFGGPLELPCVGTCQLALLQGFRWFQIRDDFMFSAGPEQPIGGGAAEAEQFYHSRTRNDLFGYQVGGRLNYSATTRLNVGVGAKMGVYANSVGADQRIGSAEIPAQYLNDLDPAGRVDVDQRSRSTVLAGLGEIDLGGGFRVSDGWAIRGGYRVLGLSGIATTPSMLAHEMYSPNLSARQLANDSMILHGAYVGTEFNW